jgi:hypothetical protein
MLFFGQVDPKATTGPSMHNKAPRGSGLGHNATNQNDASSCQLAYTVQMA